LKTKLFAAALWTAAICVAAPVAAQTPAGQAPAKPAPAAKSASASAPIVNLWYAGGFTGAAAAKKAGGVAGAEAGMRVWRTLDLLAEVGWFQNAVNSGTTAATGPLVAYLQATQGQPASASVKAPATFATIGGRWVFESQRKFRPYVIVAVGGARVNIKSSFSLGGTDITSTLATKGVTLGQDLTGHSSHVAVTAGGGVLIPLGMVMPRLGMWYLDAGYRSTSIATPGQSTNVNRFNVGFGARF